MEKNNYESQKPLLLSLPDKHVNECLKLSLDQKDAQPGYILNSVLSLFSL